MFLCTPFANRRLIYSDWAFEITLHSPKLYDEIEVRIRGLQSMGFQADSYGDHLITAVSVIKRLSFYEFTLWGRDLVSVVRIRESPYYRGFF